MQSHDSSSTIVVTGGAGFIGSHLTRALLARGASVIVYDNLSMGRRENVPKGATFVCGDILDYQQLREAVKQADTVFHLAARVSVRASMEGFYDDGETNILGTLNLLRVVRGSRVKKIVFASSMAVYADTLQPHSIPESFPTEPLSAYGISKLTSEKYLLLMAPQLGLQVRILRYFNTYGPGQGYTPYVGVITIFINRLLAGEPPMIFGTGDQQRDFVSVHDVVQASIQAMEWEGDAGVFNVGTGHGTAIRQIAEHLCDTLNPSIRPVYGPPQPGEVHHSIADISKARTYLGFEPSCTLLASLGELIQSLNRADEKRHGPGFHPHYRYCP